MARPEVAEKFSQPTKQSVLFVLHPDQIKKIEQKCNPLVVTDQSSDLKVAYTLGQQSVLKLLRDGGWE